jgi:hypothetical protein
MKKISSLIVIIFLGFSSNAQVDNKTKEYLKNIQNSENSKSGNYKDILTSFFQLATTNFTGDEKTLEMNTTLFAIKAKADTTLITGNFQEERFSRNFQFNFKLNLDDKYKYKGFTGGATYAVINARDRRLAVLTRTFYGEKFENYRTIIEAILPELNNNLSPEDTKKLTQAAETLTNNEKYDNKDNKFYDLIIEKFKEKASKIENIKHKDSKDYTTYLETLEANEFTKIDAKALWTVSIDGTAGEKGKFNKASIGTIFLQGIKEKSELDVRAKLIYADTLTVDPVSRMEFNSKAGVNFKIARGANKVSFFEIKGGLEYNSILKNILPTEKKDVFLGTAEIRIRIANDLWLPLIIKYDIEKANFLGFLNISYNFGGFKPKG